VIADFLVGAHAAEQAGRLLTRDRGFNRQAFADLMIVDPSAAGG
jgi:predicted nucleic acid-binding protein